MVGVLVAEFVRVEKSVADEARTTWPQHMVVHSKLEMLQQLAQFTLALHSANLTENNFGWLFKYGTYVSGLLHVKSFYFSVTF